MRVRSDDNSKEEGTTQEQLEPKHKRPRIEHEATDEEFKRKKRKLQNRLSARNARERKKQEVINLQKTIARQKSKIAALRTNLEELEHNQATQSAQPKKLNDQYREIAELTEVVSIQKKIIADQRAEISMLRAFSELPFIPCSDDGELIADPQPAVTKMWDDMTRKHQDEIKIRDDQIADLETKYNELLKEQNKPYCVSTKVYWPHSFFGSTLQSKSASTEQEESTSFDMSLSD